MELPYGKFLAEISAIGYQTVKDWIIINSPGLNEVTYTLTQLQREGLDKQARILAKNLEIQEDELKPTRNMPQDIIFSGSNGPLFTNKLNGVIIDNVIDIDWNEANKYYESLSLNGYSDWRMPSIEELNSISSSFFLSSRYYWSSTREKAKAKVYLFYQEDNKFWGKIHENENIIILAIRVMSVLILFRLIFFLFQTMRSGHDNMIDLILLPIDPDRLPADQAYLVQ